MEFVSSGKVKDIYNDNGNLVFKFSNRISVFDKIIPSEIPYKGEVLCRTAYYWYRLCEDLNIKTDLIGLKSNNEMVVKRYDVVNKGFNFKINYMIPIEFITRYYVAGSLYDRIKSKKIDYHDLGFKNEPEYGEKLPDPFFEMTTKREKTDRVLNTDEAMSISGMEKHEIYEMMELIFKIDRRINESVESRGLIHVDGKKEFALGLKREPVVCDTFGTPDEDRFWDLKEYKKNNIMELSKEMVRQYYRETGYHERLYSARENHEKEPDIPPLNDEMIKRISNLYIDLYQKITGLKW
ncbi:phosphoribosylaminoimidazolesuccinocarboxamide synthase [Picrophilus oshimae]|uniref:Phosphoribosylaminoimidazole-succinocarboxamide synthase n=1 Tax=Picrophilus torridus (strain ATCC 700027 / DSM 9790 / JCM 10055 / NBRC 100828 / KAW 2/3) TaxID=1122961 RepID=Q6KZB4_PICTO|nr:phosphoribosylaminoimidazolesuccinocarboxamide synthase [Picrophilus oshimae]AAT43938.1 phosphoribosylamidoimidazole-succinocarboxamide synthase [Picrophilus oshimae DSM 9789]